MEEFKDSASALIADVDCTADGKDLCQTHGVSGYPTIKYGDPEKMEDYNGGRSIDDLREFAKTKLGPICGPASLDVCNDDEKGLIEKYMKMSAGRLEGRARKQDKKLEEAETALSSKKKPLQHEMKIMYAVLAHKTAGDEKKAGDEKGEL